MKKKKTEKDEAAVDILSKLKTNLKGIAFDTLTSYEDMQSYSELVSTGSVIFDIFLDGGFRSGTTSRFIGEPEHGKTANALQWAKNWLETIDNSFVLYINSEGRLTKDLVEKSGIDTDPDKFRIWSHNIFEDIAEVINSLIYDEENTRRYFFVIDSLDAVITKDDFGKKMGDSKTVAGGARLSSYFLKKVGVRISAKGHHLMLLSQVRMSMSSKSVGQSSTTTSGGKAVEFFSSLTGRILKIYGGQTGMLIFEDRNDAKSKPIGHYFTIKFIKTYHERTHEVISIPIKYGHGVWHEQECLNLCMAYQYLTRAGAGWYSFSEEMIEIVKKSGEVLPEKLQGEQKIIDFLENSPKITNIILEHIKEMCISTKQALSELQLDDDDDDGDILNTEEI